ncbi:nacrein-like protein, partial [Saccostrea cucullata]|uniref:nacrein-like protein n=1 Tax=Saccostrea cuccullata TaxID=36930 RepID=UPI002ED5E4BB
MGFCTACLISVFLAGYSTGQLYRGRDMFKVQITDFCRTENCEKAQYSYQRNSCRGQKFWSRVTPCWETCSSSRQSPVNIITNKTRYVPRGSLQFSGFCDRVNVQFIHRGTVPHLWVYRASEIVMCNVPNRETQQYIFRDVHPHLGRREARGSEHAFDGSFYPMEMHLVFINSRYRTLQEARKKPGGLAVIGVMVEIEENKKGRRSSRQGNTYHQNPCRKVTGCRIKSATRLSHLMVKYFRKIHKEKTNQKN